MTEYCLGRDQMLDDRKKILETIDGNHKKAIKFLQDIVAIPSVTGDEGKIQAYGRPGCLRVSVSDLLPEYEPKKMQEE